MISGFWQISACLKHVAKQRGLYFQTDFHQFGIGKVQYSEPVVWRFNAVLQNRMCYYSTIKIPHLGKRSADFEETPRDIVWFSVQNLHIYRFIYKFRKLKPVINLIEKTVPFTRYNNSKSRKKIFFVKTDCGQCCIPLFWCSRFMEVTINFSRKWTFGHFSYVRTSTNTLYLSTV